MPTSVLISVSLDLLQVSEFIIMRLFSRPNPETSTGLSATLHFPYISHWQVLITDLFVHSEMTVGLHWVQWVWNLSKDYFCSLWVKLNLTILLRATLGHLFCSFLKDRTHKALHTSPSFLKKCSEPLIIKKATGGTATASTRDDSCDDEDWPCVMSPV